MSALTPGRWDRAALDGAAHILAAAHRRFDLAVTVRTLGHLNFGPIWLGQLIVYERFVTVGASCVYSHVAFGAGVGSHFFAPNERGTI